MEVIDITKDSWTAISSNGKKHIFRAATEKDLQLHHFFEPNNWLDAGGESILIKYIGDPYYVGLDAEIYWILGTKDQIFKDRSEIPYEMHGNRDLGVNEHGTVITKEIINDKFVSKFTDVFDLQKLRLHTSNDSKEYILRSVYNEFYTK